MTTEHRLWPGQPFRVGSAVHLNVLNCDAANLGQGRRQNLQYGRVKLRARRLVTTLHQQKRGVDKGLGISADTVVFYRNGADFYRFSVEFTMFSQQANS